MKRMKALGVLLLTVMIGFALSSCDYLKPQPKDNYDVADSLCVAMIQDYMDPVMTSEADVLLLKQEMLAQKEVDSVFLSLPDATINNIVHVLLAKDPNVTKKSIVKEFRQHRDVYNNLPKSPTATSDTIKNVDRQATDLGNRRDNVISTSYNYRTDTINGKPVRIKVKTEESYE